MYYCNKMKIREIYYILQLYITVSKNTMRNKSTIFFTP